VIKLLHTYIHICDLSPVGKYARLFHTASYVFLISLRQPQSTCSNDALVNWCTSKMHRTTYYLT